MIKDMRMYESMKEENKNRIIFINFKKEYLETKGDKPLEIKNIVTEIKTLFSGKKDISRLNSQNNG